MNLILEVYYESNIRSLVPTGVLEACYCIRSVL
jgi:hypothetical protein